jgi:hypothetical protein
LRAILTGHSSQVTRCSIASRPPTAAALYRRLIDAHYLRLDVPTVTPGAVDELVRLGVVMRRLDGIMLVDPATATRGVLASAHQRFAEEVEAIVALVSESYQHDQRAPGSGGAAEAAITLLSNPQRNCLLTGQLRSNAQRDVRTSFTAADPLWAEPGVNPHSSSGDHPNRAGGRGALPVRIPPDAARGDPAG